MKMFILKEKRTNSKRILKEEQVKQHFKIEQFKLQLLIIAIKVSKKCHNYMIILLLCKRNSLPLKTESRPTPPTIFSFSLQPLPNSTLELHAQHVDYISNQHPMHTIPGLKPKRHFHHCGHPCLEVIIYFPSRRRVAIPVKSISI